MVAGGEFGRESRPHQRSVGRCDGRPVVGGCSRGRSRPARVSRGSRASCSLSTNGTARTAPSFLRGACAPLAYTKHFLATPDVAGAALSNDGLTQAQVDVLVVLDRSSPQPAVRGCGRRHVVRRQAAAHRTIQPRADVPPRRVQRRRTSRRSHAARDRRLPAPGRAPAGFPRRPRIRRRLVRERVGVRQRQRCRLSTRSSDSASCSTRSSARSWSAQALASTAPGAPSWALAAFSDEPIWALPTLPGLAPCRR